MPPYLVAAYLPAAQQPGGQHLLPHADTLTAALQQQVSALSRALGPSEGVRQALQRQMLALQQNSAAQQQAGAPAAHPGSRTAPGMPAQAPVYHTSAPEQATNPAAPRVMPQLTAQLPRPAMLKRTAATQCTPEGASKKAKPAANPVVGGAEPVNSALDSCAPLAAQVDGQAQGAGAPRPLPAGAWQAAVQAPAAAGGAAAGHASALNHVLDTDAAAQRLLSAGFGSAAEAAAAFGRPTAPVGQPPSGAEAALVSCTGCGARWHVGCLPAEAQQQVSPHSGRKIAHCRVSIQDTMLHCKTF